MWHLALGPERRGGHGTSGSQVARWRAGLAAPGRLPRLRCGDQTLNDPQHLSFWQVLGADADQTSR